MKEVWKKSRRTGGQALTEFILVIPLFFVLLLGVVQLSLLYCAFQMAQYASFSTARAAAVRPCTAFHPDDSDVAYFSPAVFTAAALSMLPVAPPQELFRGQREFPWMPLLPDTAQVRGLDYRMKDRSIPDFKYANAVYLTSVQRVRWNEAAQVWVPYGPGPGPGLTGNCWNPDAQQQNVPASGSDITLEVTFLYPMNVPLVNRVVYGIFVNFSAMAQDAAHPRYLGLTSILGSGDRPEEEVMVMPARRLPDPGEYFSSVEEAVDRMFLEFGYSEASLAQSAGFVAELQRRAWYPIPVRARCTLTVEASPYPLIKYP